MLNFLPSSVEQPVVKNTLPIKVRLTKDDLALKYVMVSNRNNMFTVTYLVSIFVQNPTNPALPLQYNQVDLMSLKEAIFNKFKKEDQKYVTFLSFDTSKVIVKFNHELWIKEAFAGVAGTNRFSKFEIEFKLKKQIPMFIVFDGFMPMFFEFIQPKMAEFVKKNNLGKSYFMKIASSSLVKKVERYYGSMVDYIYNYQQGIFSIKLKSAYILLFVYGMSTVMDDKSFMNISEKDFEETTRKFVALNKFK